MELSSQTAGKETAPNQGIYGPKYDTTSKIQNQNKKSQGVNPLPDLQSTQGKVLIFPKKIYARSKRTCACKETPKTPLYFADKWDQSSRSPVTTV